MYKNRSRTWPVNNDPDMSLLQTLTRPLQKKKKLSAWLKPPCCAEPLLQHEVASISSQKKKRSTRPSTSQGPHKVAEVEGAARQRVRWNPRCRRSCRQLWGECAVCSSVQPDGDKCENTVLLETRRPCESVRKCGADTVTDDTSVRVENVTPVTLGVTFARCQKKKN